MIYFFSSTFHELGKAEAMSDFVSPNAAGTVLHTMPGKQKMLSNIY